MAVIAPFRAWRYSTEKISDLSSVLAPPYDVIEPAQQRQLHERHPWNVIRLESGESFPDDTPRENRYSRAADFLRAWQREGVLRRDEVPAVYVSQQDFEGPDGRRLARRGFVCLLRLEPLEGGTVFPHEQTFPKHKADRLSLLRACRAHFNPIFSIFPDEDSRVEALLGVGDLPLAGEAWDDRGVRHRLWPLEDPTRIRALVQAMGDRPVFIADGHHRYETCLRYEQERAAAETPSRDPVHWALMYLTPMEGEGLVIYPTHKMVQDVPGLDAAGLLKALSVHFRVEPYAAGRQDPVEACRGFQRSLREAGEGGCALGLAVAADPPLWILTPRDLPGLTRDLSHLPQCIRGLDVSILHAVVLKGVLGIDVSDPADRHLSYVREAQEAVTRVRGGQVQAAFIMNPTRVEALKAVAAARCTMPQKATYFYPKLLSGLVIHTLDEPVQG
jgi:uncharacterized protein (DUF1015 family)